MYEAVLAVYIYKRSVHTSMLIAIIIIIQIKWGQRHVERVTFACEIKMHSPHILILHTLMFTASILSISDLHIVIEFNMHAWVHNKTTFINL